MQNVRKYINIRNEKKTQRKKEIATTGEVAVFAQHDRVYFLSTQLKYQITTFMKMYVKVVQFTVPCFQSKSIICEKKYPFILISKNISVPRRFQL